MKPDLSQRQIDRAREMRAKVHRIIPEAIPFIEDLVREGVIRGWRDVEFVGTAEEAVPRNAAIAERALTAAQFKFLGEKENQKWTISPD